MLACSPPQLWDVGCSAGTAGSSCSPNPACHLSSVPALVTGHWGSVLQITVWTELDGEMLMLQCEVKGGAY